MKRLFFPFFQLLYRISLLRHRFSKVGMFLWVALLFSAALGIDTKSTMVHQLFMFLVALFLMSFLYVWLAHFKPPTLKIHRRLPAFVTVGETFQYQLSIENCSSKNLHQVQVQEYVQYPAPTFDAFTHALEPDEYKRNRFDRDIGYYRFVWLHRQQRGLSSEVSDLETIKSQQQLKTKLAATAIRRGNIYLNEVQFRQTEPLGLLFQIHRSNTADKVLALPRRYRLPPSFNMLGSRQHQKNNMTLVSNIGESDEFHTLREYQTGDSPRHIHWPSWAKTNKPMVKQFQDEHAVRQALILDSFACAASQQDSQVFEEAVSVAASFSATLDSGDSLLDLMFVGDDCQRLNIGRSLAHAEQMLEALASISLCHEKSFSALAQFTMQHVSVISSCILVLMDWGKDRQELVTQLHASNTEVLILLILPKKAASPPLGVMQAYSHQFKCLSMGNIEQDLMRI